MNPLDAEPWSPRLSSISTSAELSQQCGGEARVYNVQHHEALKG
jgi:hypothetical protein